jgi:hypothetical protein
MAIPILNHLDLRSVSELQNAILHKTTTSSASNVEGKLIYDTSSDTLKFYNGSNWLELGTSGGSVTSVAITGTDGIDVDSGSPITSAGTITLGLSNIANSKLANSTVSYGGVSLALGGTDATPAFDLQDATGYPTSSLTGTITNAQLAGSIANAKLANSSVSYGGVSLSLGGSDATPAFDLSDATNYPTSSLSGTITNAQLAGSIANAKLANSSITVNGSAIALGGSVNTLQLGTSSSTALAGDTAVDNVSIANLKTKLAGGFASNAVTIGDSSDVVTIGNDLVVTGDLTVSGDTISANVGTLDVEDKNITLNKSAGNSSSTADGAGLTIQDAVDASTDATLLWNASSDKFVFSHLIDAPGTSIFVNLDISGDVDVDGTLEADAITINGTATGALALLNTVGTSQIDNGAVTSLKIADDAVTNAKINDDAVDTGQLVNLAVTTAKLDNAAVTNAKLANSAITIDGTSVSLGGSVTTNNTQLSFASAAEVQAGTNTTKAINPDKLAAKSVHATIDVSDSTFTSNLYAEITHSLGSEDVIVQCFDSSTKETIFADVARTDKSDSASTSKVKISFSAAPTNDIEVLITSIQGSTAGSVAYS